MMKFDLFKSFTLTWWQGSIFKLALLSLGLAVGSTWPDVFAPLRVVLLPVYVVCAGYITVVWWKQ